MKLYTVDFKNKKLVNSESRNPNSIESNPTEVKPASLDQLRVDVSNSVKRFEESYSRHDIAHLTTKFSKRMGDTLILDTYNFGDVHNSVYSKGYQRAYNSDFRTRWNRPTPVPSCPSHLEKLINNSECKEVVLGNLSDSFQWLDKRNKFSQLALFLIKTKGLKLTINTRSDLIASDEYIELLDRDKTVINIYIPSHGNERITQLEEPGAPSLARRRQAADKLRDLGFKVEVIKQKLPKSMYAEAERRTGIRHGANNG